jgi:hypothetical protein
MSFKFNLCPTCLNHFRALEFNAEAHRGSNLIPFNSLCWDDELPAEQEELDFLHHEPCKTSIIRLYATRRALWDSGRIPDQLKDFWQHAQETIPDWAGFKRLVLSQDDRAALKFCDEETEELMDSFRKDASVFSMTDQGGGVIGFTAHPPAKTPKDAGATNPSADQPN